MEKILAGLRLDQLQEIARKTYSDPRDLASIVFEKVLAELERRMPSAEFVTFCETIENFN